MYRKVALMDFFEGLENGSVEKFHEELGSEVVWDERNSIRIPWYLMTPRSEAGRFSSSLRVTMRRGSSVMGKPSSLS